MKTFTFTTCAETVTFTHHATVTVDFDSLAVSITEGQSKAEQSSDTVWLLASYWFQRLIEILLLFFNLVNT